MLVCRLNNFYYVIPCCDLVHTYYILLKMAKFALLGKINKCVIKTVTVKKIPDTVVFYYCVWYLFNCNTALFICILLKKYELLNLFIMTTSTTKSDLYDHHEKLAVKKWWKYVVVLLVS